MPFVSLGLQVREEFKIFEKKGIMTKSDSIKFCMIFFKKTWVRKIHWRRDRLLTPVFSGLPCGSAGKESACNVGDLGSIPGSSILAWRSPWTV